MRMPVVPCLLLCVICVPGCVGSGDTKTTVVTNMKGEAKRTETVDLALSRGDTLVLIAELEDVEVRRASRSSALSAELSIVAYTQKEAERALRAFRVATERTSRGLEVRIVGDAGTYEIVGGVKVPYRVFASFTATVPERVKVIAGTRSGDLEVRGD